MPDDQTPIFRAADDDDEDLTSSPEDPNGSPRFETFADPTAPATDREEAARSLLAAIETGDNHEADMPHDDGDSTDGSGPTAVFNFRGFEPPSDHPLFFELEAWVRLLVWHFELGEIVSPCWAEHPAVVEEMAGLYEGWTGIYTAGAEGHHPMDQLSWLGHLDSSLARVATKWDRSGCGPRGVHEDKTRSVWPDMAEADGPHSPVVSALVGMTTGDAEPF